MVCPSRLADSQSPPHRSKLGTAEGGCSPTVVAPEWSVQFPCLLGVPHTPCYKSCVGGESEDDVVLWRSGCQDDCRSSGRLLFFLIQSVLEDHPSGPWSIQSGPCHQSLDSASTLGPAPLDAKSAGFVVLGTCLQFIEDTLATMSPTRLLT